MVGRAAFRARLMAWPGLVFGTKTRVLFHHRYSHVFGMSGFGVSGFRQWP
jgi:hypothetical protein